MTSPEEPQLLREVDIGNGRLVKVWHRADGHIAVELIKDIEPDSFQPDGELVQFAITESRTPGKLTTRFSLTLEGADALRRALNSIPTPPR